jgi:hypothetical protein
MNYLALADNRLLNPANVRLIGYSRNFHRNLQADLVIWFGRELLEEQCLNGRCDSSRTARNSELMHSQL